MSVVLLIAVAAILGGVIAVAFGHGGELASFAADVPPLRAEVVTAADAPLIRPPTALFGYHPQVTDDLVGTLARTLSDRQAEIASLRRQLAELQASGAPAARVGAAEPGESAAAVESAESAG